jgi:conjugative transfer signal peptidase TraF
MRRAAIWVAFAFLVGWCAIAAGLRWNGSRSFPVGFYLAAGKHAKKGDLIFVSPPPSPVFTMARDRGYLNVGWSPAGHILKRLAGVPGDRVTIDSAGVMVNGVCLANSTPLLFDGAGRPLRAFVMNRVLGPDEVLLMSDYNPASFDSRYFGPLQATTIESVVRPLLTW